ncbi:MAG: CBS domain-containing protein [Gemmatimonadota bacterium]|nr:CBS domain-containing protein [Gemmatimonadota bacterium]MDH4349658.1 CBS domain-containing protein [Gemmatimonadota bacterium]MDH5195856.1 CBS domain-containing protein [Gemmatimonadota bacterium]
MSGGFLLGLVGVGAAAIGSMIVAGAGGVSRLALARWVSQRQHGSALAAALLSAPATVVGPALWLTAGGLLLAGIGLAAVLAPLTAARTIAALVLGVPATLALTYSIPRAIGHRWPEPLIRAAAPWLERVARLAGPLVPAGPVGGGLPTRHGADTVGEDEIIVLAGVLTFTERTVREVMTPRTEIVGLEEGTLAREAAVCFTESGYSRLPMYRESLDHITGMAYVFDVLKVSANERLPVRPILAVPATRRCVDLLFDLQRERRQLAVALDEFGGTAGIVTLEDLLEELVGEISDETDAAVVEETGVANLMEVDGTMGVQEIAARFGVTLPGGRETVGGVLATALGRIPLTGERIVLGGLEFDILRASPTRVERLVVRPAAARPTTVVRG